MSVEPVICVNLRDLEKAVIQAALSKYPGRKPEIAAALGISLKALYLKIHRYGIEGVRPCRRSKRKKRRTGP